MALRFMIRVTRMMTATISDECDVDSTGGADCDANGEDDSIKTAMAPLTRVTPM